MSEYDDWKQENDRWEAYLYPNGVLRNKLGITKAAKWHKMEREFVAARSAALRPNTGLTTGNVGEELFAGTTSACAENKLLRIFPPPPGRNYLRVRGEYKPPAEDRAWHPELPPRARRIRRSVPAPGKSPGTTSACAENTLTDEGTTYVQRNYLRVRGEYALKTTAGSAGRELPPRARRIHGFQDRKTFYLGTTSACAENTGQGHFAWCR